MCYSDFVKIVEALNLKEIANSVDEREECMTSCFIARRGSTDSEYCIERCNETFNNSLKKSLHNFSNVF